MFDEIDSFTWFWWTDWPSVYPYDENIDDDDDDENNDDDDDVSLIMMIMMLKSVT